MQLLYVANRFEYRQRLDIWLAAGDIVVCDRYRASSMAYGEAQGLDPHGSTDIQQYLPVPALTRAARHRPGHGRRPQVEPARSV